MDQAKGKTRQGPDIMALADLDHKTISLVIQLQMDDLDAMKDTKGKHREGEMPDTELAIAAYETELERQKQLLLDHSMTESIARAVCLDADAIKAIVAQERQAMHDRQVATGLASGEPHGSATSEQAAVDTDLDPKLLDRLAALYVCPRDDGHNVEDDDNQGDGDSVLDAIECDSCNDRSIPEKMAYCSCPHKYCLSCLEVLVRSSLTDESLFPPRCCRQEINLDSGLLPAQLIGEFRAKKIEFETPNRTYCHRPTCSTFIPVQFIQDEVATCVRCNERTCAVCKGAPHEGDCPHDPATQEVLRVASENGWQSCYSCHRLVELELGCNHMTCICRAEFCYACGRTWKTCECDSWDEARLLDRANVLVNRYADGRLPVGENRANLVNRARAHLVANHECTHATWTSRQGSHRCEECHDTLPIFIYECNQCRILACRRCRFNRL